MSSPCGFMSSPCGLMSSGISMYAVAAGRDVCFCVQRTKYGHAVASRALGLGQVAAADPHPTWTMDEVRGGPRCEEAKKRHELPAIFSRCLAAAIARHSALDIMHLGAGPQAEKPRSRTECRATVAARQRLKIAGSSFAARGHMNNPPLPGNPLGGAVALWRWTLNVDCAG
jgi:hypothetical protein